MSKSLKLNKSNFLSGKSGSSPSLIGDKKNYYYQGNQLSGIDEHSHENNDMSLMTMSIMNQSMKTSSQHSSESRSTYRRNNSNDLQECYGMNTPRNDNLEEISVPETQVKMNINFKKQGSKDQDHIIGEQEQEKYLDAE